MHIIYNQKGDYKTGKRSIQLWKPMPEGREGGRQRPESAERAVPEHPR